MGHSSGDVAHVERGEGGWLWDCTIELVLVVLDDRLEVFEDVEAAFPKRQDGLVELLLLLWDVVLEGHGEGGSRRAPLRRGEREKRCWGPL